MIGRVYFSQKRRPQKDDWFLTVQQDLKELGIEYDENKLKNMNKFQFKIFMKKATEKAAFDFLQKIQKKHSKMENIHYNRLNLQSYFKNDMMTTEEKQFLLKLRTSMSEVKVNFKSMYLNNLECDLCDKNEIQTVQHLLECPAILNCCMAVQNNFGVKFVEIFPEVNSNVENQLKTLRIVKAVFEAKSKLQEGTRS